MKFTCPNCGYVGDTAKAQAALVEAINKLYARFGLEEAAAREYMLSFRAALNAPVYPPKEQRQLQALLVMWETREFEHRSRIWRITREAIRDAMLIACNNELVGLKNHNYIKAILYKQAMQEDARAEKQKHARAVNRPRTADQGMSRIGPLPEKVYAHPAETNDPDAVKRAREEAHRKLKIRKGGE